MSDFHLLTGISRRQRDAKKQGKQTWILFCECFEVMFTYIFQIVIIFLVCVLFFSLVLFALLLDLCLLKLSYDCDPVL